MVKKTRKFWNDLVRFRISTEIILKSGLLLDDDFEPLWREFNSNFDDSAPTGYRWFHWFIGACALTGTAIAVLKFTSPRVVVATGAIFVTTVGIILRKIHKRRRDKRNLESVVQEFRNNLKLNRLILAYLRQRRAAGASGGDVTFSPFTPKIRELLRETLHQQSCLMGVLKDVVRFCGAIVPTVNETYLYLDDVELEMSDLEFLEDIDACIKYHENLCDLLLLVTSNTLACMGLSFCPNLWVPGKKSIQGLFDQKLPQLRKAARSCFENVNKKFHSAKYEVFYTKPPKIQGKSLDNIVSSKLQTTLLETMLLTSLLIEKAHNVFDKMQSAQSDPDQEDPQMLKYLTALKNDAQEYSDSVAVLCKLYETLQKAKPKPLAVTQKLPNKTEGEQAVESKEAGTQLDLPELQKLDDDEWKCDMSVEENEPTLEGSCTSLLVPEEDILQYMSLVNQEIKRKLKDDPRFAAAREKRGIVDEVTNTEMFPSKDHPPRPSKATSVRPANKNSLEFSGPALEFIGMPIEINMPASSGPDAPRLRPPPPPPVSTLIQSPSEPDSLMMLHPERSPSDDSLDSSLSGQIRAACRKRGQLREDFFGDDETLD